MSKTYTGYLNNFPRESAVKGQKFEGTKTLEDELKARGIIGEIEEVEATIVLNSAAKIKQLGEVIKKLKEDSDGELLEEVERLDGEKTVLTLEVERLTKLLEESIDLNKGKVPDGYTRVA